MKRVTTNHIPESYQTIKHSSGLDILLYPMEGFSSAYALFATKYGSVDTTFKTKDNDDFVSVPEGIAHFLEHKLFENQDGIDTFEKYAKTGASANAYTSFDRTAYLFSCTDNFKESLEILLDFVTHPYFTPETVKKEQGIIGQEINMYQDDPDWRVFFGLLSGMYHNNPVAIDIAGTVDSIGEIDADLLYRCYHTFYNLNNMVLVLAGNFDPEEALSVADVFLEKQEDNGIQRSFPEEPESVKTPLVEIKLNVAQPLFHMGFKKIATDEKADFPVQIKTEILLEMIAGEATDFYQKLYEQGLINATFSSSAESGPGYAYSTFSGESKEPKEAERLILEEINRLKKEGLSKDSFVQCKKALWGHFVGMYGSVTGVAGLTLSSHFSGANAYYVLDVISSTTFEEMEEILNRDFQQGKTVLSIVNPKE